MAAEGSARKDTNKANQKADDELPPPRGVRWELSEKQLGCLWVLRGVQRRDYPPSCDASTRRNPSLQTSRNTKHYSPSTVEGVVPLSCTPHDGEWTWVLHLSCPTIVYGTGARRVRAADAEQKMDMTKTT